MSRRAGVGLLTAVGLLAVGVVAAAAGLGPWKAGSVSTPSRTALRAPAQEEAEAAYDGRYTFVRVRFGDVGGGLRDLGYGGRRRGRGRGAPWSHDYPRAERNFAKILDATTLTDTRMEGNAGRILTLDDPEIFKYPVLNIIEVGYWRPSQEEVTNLRDYLEKGGFMIVDDTRSDRGFEMQNFYRVMNQVLPGREIMYVPLDHEIFDSFFFIEDPLALVPPYGWHQPQYLGVFENNDPAEGRIMVMINWNQDLQEYWEYSDVGYYPIDLANDAYKFGVNYVIYAHTH